MTPTSFCTCLPKVIRVCYCLALLRHANPRHLVKIKGDTLAHSHTRARFPARRTPHAQFGLSLSCGKNDDFGFALMTLE